MAVTNELARFGARRGEAHAVDHVVEPLFKQLQQGFASDAAGPLGQMEVAAKLAFHQPVHALDLLLLAQLGSVLGKLAASLPMLAGGIVASFNRALIRVAAFALQEQLQAFASAQPTHRFRITSQPYSSLNSDTTALGWTTAVVRNRRDVLDDADGKAGRL